MGGGPSEPSAAEMERSPQKKKNTSSEAHTRADFMAHEIKQPAEYI